MKKAAIILGLMLSHFGFSQVTDTGDKVGIGTTTPDEKLHVTGKIKLQNENPEFQFHDNTGSTYYADLRYTDNKFHYRWGQGIKHTFENDAFVIGDYIGGENEVKISRVGNSWFNGGNVGIGTDNPKSSLHIYGEKALDWQESTNDKGTGLITIGQVSKNGSLFVNTPTHSSSYSSGLGVDGSYENRNSLINIKAFGVKYNDWNSSLAFHTSNGVSINEAMRIDKNGNLGIGTTAPDAKLAVRGNIHTQEVKVDLLGAVAPDYVFYKDYDLKTLTEVENYINKKGHLPNIPSAEQMEEEGIKLKEMNLKLLEKIEELTLYTIDQEKRIETLESKNEKLILLVEKLLEKAGEE